MSTNRSLLHRTKIDEFVSWACAHGLAPVATGYQYEKLRLVREAGAPILIYDRDKGEHFTTFGDGTDLVLQWLDETRAAKAK